MQPSKSPPPSSHSSKISHNFQLLKSRTYNTNPNPQQLGHPPPKSQQFRYDYDYSQIQDHKQKQKSHSFRVKRSLPRNPKSENGRTVYEIRNLRRGREGEGNTAGLSVGGSGGGDPDGGDKTLSSKSQIMFINRKNIVLETDRKMTEPRAFSTHKSHQQSQYIYTNKQLHKQIQKYQPEGLNIRKNRPLYFQKQWSIRQPQGTPLLQPQKAGSIIKQQLPPAPPQQSPLSPSSPQKIQQLLVPSTQPVTHPNLKQLQNIPQQQCEQPTIQANSVYHQGNRYGRSRGKGARGQNQNQNMVCDRELIEKINARTKYSRYRHYSRIRDQYAGITSSGGGDDLINGLYYGNGYQLVSKIKQPSMSSSHPVHEPKHPNPNKPQTLQFHHNSPIQDLIKALHHQTLSKLLISIKVPLCFHQLPDVLLSDQELKFKARLIFEDLDIGRMAGIDAVERHGAGGDGVGVLRHMESLMFVYDMSTSNAEGKHQHKSSTNTTNQRPIPKYCINWYKDGSVYMGQLQEDYRHGIGLEWVPGVYVYYGQYQQNYRHGYGVMKYNNKEVYIGLWAYDCYYGYGKLIDEEGLVVGQGVWRNKQVVKRGEYSQLS